MNKQRVRGAGVGGSHVFLSTGHFLGSVGITLSGDWVRNGGAGRAGVGAFSGRGGGKGETRPEIRPHHAGAGFGPSPEA